MTPKWLQRWRDRADKPDTDPVAEEALADVEDKLCKARERQSEISEIARTLHALQRRNHIAPMVRDALGGRFK